MTLRPDLKESTPDESREASAGLAVRLLRVRYAFELQRRDLGAFRGALVSHAGRDIDRLHNHAPGEERFLYRYPLVQYRVEARQAAIFAIGDGGEDIRQLLNQPMPMLHINGRRVALRVDDVDIDYYQPCIGSTMLHYELHNYLPLSQQNEANWREMDDYARGDYLTRLLTGHILAFAQGIGWKIVDRIRIELEGVRELGLIKYKGVGRPAYDVRFLTNVELPPGIGLGKAVAMGFGVVQRRRQ